jgi:hypothetical protein
MPGFLLYTIAQRKHKLLHVNFLKFIIVNFLFSSYYSHSKANNEYEYSLTRDFLNLAVGTKLGIDFICIENDFLDRVSLNLFVNKNPNIGYCSINAYENMILTNDFEMFFEISCTDWSDDDGFIDFYEFLGKILNNWKISFNKKLQFLSII